MSAEAPPLNIEIAVGLRALMVALAAKSGRLQPWHVTDLADAVARLCDPTAPIVGALDRFVELSRTDLPGAGEALHQFLLSRGPKAVAATARRAPEILEAIEHEPDHWWQQGAMA